MARIDIIRKLEGNIEKVEFDPPELQAAIGEGVFWRNLDSKEEHWITREGKPDDFFFSSRLAPFVEGQPPDTTSQITAQNAETVVYVCSVHPGEPGQPGEPREQGTIIFS